MEDTLKQGAVGQFVCFKLVEEEYAIDITYVREVIRVTRITPIPQMPRFCLGVINIRGNVVPVFDLRIRFGLSEKPFNNLTKILVASVDQIMISVVVDEILENIKLEMSQIDPAPSVKMKVEKECVMGIGELEGRMITILDLAKTHEFIMKDIKYSGAKGK